MSYLNEKGQEVLDDTPMVIPLKYREKSFIEQMRAYVDGKLSQMAYERDMETMEDADDFDVGDDYDPTSPYEYEFEPVAQTTYSVDERNALKSTPPAPEPEQAKEKKEEPA